MITSQLRATVDQLCATLPGAELALSEAEIPSWKVGGKMFVCYGHSSPGISVKCDSVETASMLIDAGTAERARYFHRSWVHLPDETPADEVAHRVTVSYDLIRSKLTKAQRDALPPREGA